MPNSFIGKSDDQEGFEWLHIDDFTPGIYDYDYATSEYSDIATVPAPLGSAYGPLTVGCIGLPSGGLVPLPWLDSEPIPFGSLTDPTYIVGIETNTARFSNYLSSTEAQDTEIIIIYESETGSAHVFGAFSYLVNAASSTAVVFSSSALTGVFWGSPYPYWTLITPVGEILAQLSLVFPSIVESDSQGTVGHMYVYPPSASRNTYGTDDIAAANTEPTGQLVTYDGRIMGLAAGVNVWPPSGTVTVRPNEYIWYTDPPSSEIYGGAGGDAVATLVPENPFGYGAAGSISAGELFLVKRRGGGVLVYGDIDVPSTVVTLPGVQPTGNFFGRGESTQLGFIYCSQGFGAWVWNGSNVSQKISSQLDNNFFEVEQASQMGIVNNYGFFVKRWGDYILFSNNYLYSTVTNSWWKLYDPADIQFYHYITGIDQHTLYAVPLYITPEDNDFLFEFDNRVGNPSYTWTSTELLSHVSKTNDRVFDVRRIELKVSSLTATGHIQVAVLSHDNVVWDSGGVSVPVSASSVPQILRYNVGDTAKGLENLKIQVTCFNTAATPGSSHAAPTLWSIDVALRTRAKVATSTGN